MKLVFLTIDGNHAPALRVAAERLRREHGLELSVACFDAATLRDEAGWQRLDRDLARADMVFGARLFGEDYVRPLVERLARLSCPVLIITSNPALMQQTRIGKFTLAKRDEEAGNLFSQWVKKLRPQGGAGEARRQLAILRNLSKVLKLIPGKARDLYTYIASHQYWLNSSPENLYRLICLLAARYVPGDHGHLPILDPVSYPEVALFHPDAPEPFATREAYERWRAEGHGLYGRTRVSAPAAHEPAIKDKGTRGRGDKGLSRIIGKIIPGAQAKAAPAAPNAVGTVGLLVLRTVALSGNTAHLRALAEALEARGLTVLMAYASGLDQRPAIEAFFLDGGRRTADGGRARGDMAGGAQGASVVGHRSSVDLLINASGFALVGGPAESRPAEARVALADLDVPYMSLVPLAFQRVEDWQRDASGLAPIQSALSVAVPELEGATEPMVYGGASLAGEAFVPLAGAISQIADRVAAHIALRRKANAEKRIALVIFNFPPNLGNIGTAAYLDVFHSIYGLLQALRADGYTVELPADADELRRLITEGNALAHGTQANVAARLPLDDYRRLFPAEAEIEPFWGRAPGELLSDGKGFHILGRQLGNVFIGVQPSFGYERDPMRLLMAKDAAPNHAFAAFYTWLRSVYGADAVVHFGTHGALEFMPGKQVGLSADCWPTRLIGALPNFYYYSVNNPSEAAIAKRRSMATLVSYLVPPLQQAGLYKGLRALKDSIDRYRQQPDDALLEDILAQAGKLGMTAGQGGTGTGGHGDRSTQPSGHASDYAVAESPLSRTREKGPGGEGGSPADALIAALSHELLEIEQRMIPAGLHVIGRPPAAAELVDFLALTATFHTGGAADKGTRGQGAGAIAGRVQTQDLALRVQPQDLALRVQTQDLALRVPTQDIASLPALIARGLGYDYAALKERMASDLAAQDQWRQVEAITKEAVRRFIFGGHGDVSAPTSDPRSADAYLASAAHISPGTLAGLWAFLGRLLENLLADGEIGGMLHALRGGFVTPSPSNDVVRDPSVVPTGRNVYSLDPARVPTMAAMERAEKLARELLERLTADQGALPQTVAVVLWGSDNLKSDCEGVAQVLALLGARPQPDELGNVSSVTLVPLEQLGRPRIDVAVTVSGIFRDLLGGQMALIDQAARMAALADEPEAMNYVRAHATAQATALAVPLEEAATRVFANAPGSYGANVNHLVESGTWEDDGQLSSAFLSRKSFTLGKGGAWRESRQLMERVLGTVDASFQNVDSFEVGISDIDNYYESLGGLTKSVETLSGKRPAVLVADAVAVSGRVSSLEQAVRLETRAKLLNPKWYEAMLAHGYEGAREIEARVNNTYGWSATAGAVEGWVYQGVAETFVLDEQMRQRLAALNPHAAAGVARRLLEANGRGFWDADEATLDRLREIYADLEDRLEGILS